MTSQIIKPEPHTPIQLSDFDPNYTGGLNKEETKAATKLLQKQMEHLQEMMYAQGKYSLLIVLQAMDAGGKDSTIEKVFEGLNPQGIVVSNFKKPSPRELSHDFLWRIHRATPRKGYIGIFNRSHYEDVLVVRVNNLVHKDVWSKRYDHINNFERLLTDSGTRIIKFFLHISKEEQKERFQDRLDKPDKHWKFSVDDLPVREQWDDYMRAFEDVLTKCNTDYAPWHIIPANKKWYRNYIVTQAIVNTLESMPLAYPVVKADLTDVEIPD